MSNETQQQQVTETETQDQVTEDVVQASGSVSEATETDQNADNETEEDYNALVDRYDEAISASETPETEQQAQADSNEQQDVQQPAAESAPVESPSPADTRVDVMYQKFEEDLLQKANQDFDGAVSKVKEASPAFQALPDRYVRGILEQEVKSDPRLLRAFQNRHIDPKAWNDIVVAKGKSMSKEVKALPDEAATNGQAALRASVNSQSGNTQATTYSNQDINEMSDSEFSRKMESGEFS